MLKPLSTLIGLLSVYGYCTPVVCGVCDKFVEPKPRCMLHVSTVYIYIYGMYLSACTSTRIYL
jgi:hypothetical protein